MNQIEAIIFDWAGTTIDYGCFAPVETFIKVFSEYDLYPTIEEIRKPMGMLKRDHIKTLLEIPRINKQWEKKYKRPYTENDLNEMHSLFEKQILDVVADFTSPNPFVLETVNALKEKGIKIGSTTGYTDLMMEVVSVNATKKGYHPDAYFTPDATAGIGRPYPYMIFKNLEKLKVLSVKNVLKVGDTRADILEGCNAGVISIGVIQGSSELGLTIEEFNALSPGQIKEVRKKVSDVFLNAGAHYVINDFREILPLIQKIENDRL